MKTNEGTEQCGRQQKDERGPDGGCGEEIAMTYYAMQATSQQDQNRRMALISRGG